MNIKNLDKSSAAACLRARRKRLARLPTILGSTICLERRHDCHTVPTKPVPAIVEAYREYLRDQADYLELYERDMEFLQCQQG